MTDLEAKKAKVNQLKREKKLLQQQLHYYKGEAKGQQERGQLMKDEIEEEKLEVSLRKNEIELKERELEVYDAIMNDDIKKKLSIMANMKITLGRLLWNYCL